MSTVSYHYHPHIIEEQKQAEAAFLAQFETGAYRFEAPLVLGNRYLIHRDGKRQDAAGRYDVYVKRQRRADAADLWPLCRLPQ